MPLDKGLVLHGQELSALDVEDRHYVCSPGTHLLENVSALDPDSTYLVFSLIAIGQKHVLSSSKSNQSELANFGLSEFVSRFDQNSVMGSVIHVKRLCPYLCCILQVLVRDCISCAVTCGGWTLSTIQLVDCQAIS
jgi:hypothetical protein